jgi:hypothetical protein
MRQRLPQILGMIGKSLEINGGDYGARTRELRRDRPAISVDSKTSRIPAQEFRDRLPGSLGKGQQLREHRGENHPSSFPSNFSERASEERLNGILKHRRISKLALTAMPPEQKVAGSNPAGRIKQQGTQNLGTSKRYGRFLRGRPIYFSQFFPHSPGARAPVDDVRDGRHNVMTEAFWTCASACRIRWSQSSLGQWRAESPAMAFVPTSPVKWHHASRPARLEPRSFRLKVNTRPVPVDALPSKNA